MSGKAKGEPSEGAASKAKVKQQIKTIVEDLELVLGDLKDVAKELKEVVDQIDSLTSDLQLEEEMTDSSKTDTLNSSSSSTTTTTTASSLEKIKLHTEVALIKPPSAPPAILTVLKKPYPPPPPPRLTPIRCDNPSKTLPAVKPVKTNGTLLRNGGLQGIQKKIPNGDICCISQNTVDKVPIQPTPHKPDKDRCPQVTRERVRFSEQVQYHGYCPDCDVRYDIKNRDVHLHTETLHAKLKPLHHCPPPPPPLPSRENGGMGICVSHSFPPLTPTSVPPPAAPKPQKTILRKSTTTTV
ncbi:protein Largen isoform X1 [Polypterus senegalus]|uniref:protein Largen isoform X1 n=2 Tax=Polypterus senegalus TaxID=55291 RepID=UPI00196621DA|nr:protein Largen isoform X1 [Polypterus senegalus]